MRIILRNDQLRDRAISEIARLDLRKVFSVQIEEYHPPRSLDQNAYLHAVPLKLICEATGYDLEEMKTYLLGEAFGWAEKDVFGRKVVQPLRRSSSLNTKEFGWFLEWIEQWAMGTLGLLIPRPNEELT